MKKIIITFLIIFSLMFFPNFALSELLLFSEDDEFLGCFDCSKYDSGSICIKYWTYGSTYNSNSIWNRYGAYGSKYNSYSPWNTYSSSGPKIVDRNGNFLAKTVSSIDIGINPTETIDQKKLLSNREEIFKNIIEEKTPFEKYINEFLGKDLPLSLF